MAARATKHKLENMTANFQASSIVETENESCIGRLHPAMRLPSTHYINAQEEVHSGLKREQHETQHRAKQHKPSGQGGLRPLPSRDGTMEPAFLFSLKLPSSLNKLGSVFASEVPEVTPEMGDVNEVLYRDIQLTPC